MSSPRRSDSTLRDRRGEHRPPASARLVALVVGGLQVDVPAHPLVFGRTRLGRSPDSPLGLLSDPRVSRVHAVISATADGELSIENESASGTEVNGQPITRAPLRDGDLVTMGASAFLVRTSTELADTAELPELIGRAPAMRAIRRATRRVARADMSVLLLGESGTGKEVTAQALHRASGRSGPFVALNCAAIPRTLAESQLFGHVAGAFTGAQKASAGVFRAARGGTLFLDEIAELPIDLQPKLLRVLEERQVAAVGSVTPMPIDTRVIAATNRDVVDEVRTGRFRGDLYARLAEFTLVLPPLRERREDILPILAHQYGGPLPPMRFELLRALLLHPWPFNVRELRTIASHLRMVAEDLGHEPLQLASVGDRLSTAARLTTPSAGSASEAELTQRPAVPNRAQLLALIEEHKGNVAEIARGTGRSRKQVYRWIAALQLDAERQRSRD